MTENIRHFPAAALAPHAIEAVTADEFLSRFCVLDEAAALVWAELGYQAGAKTRPPQDRLTVLGHLRPRAPAFVAAVLDWRARAAPEER